ncbi:MAG: hypothetical protein V1872_10425 [bacterium]
MDVTKSKVLSDTHPDIEEYMLKRWREMPSWEKMKLVNDMSMTVCQLALTGLKRRYPNMSEEEEKKRMAGLFLGRDWAIKLFGWDPDINGY